MLIGFIINFILIILTGNYDPVTFPDGNLLAEDSSAYDLAFDICYTIGTCGK